MLSNAAILSGATWTPTGGSTVTFASDGRQIDNGLSLVVPADTNLVTRRTLKARSSLPALPANSASFAKLGRNSLVYGIPFVASDGKLYVQTIKIEASFHAEYAQKATRMNEAVPLLADADFSDFWTNSILS